VALEACPNSSPEAFVFPNKKGGFMDSNNYRKRVLHRLEQELELPKLTFQVIRRTIARLAQKKGTVKDIQGVLRHSRMATTTDVYMQEIPESVQKTVDAISAELRLLPNFEEVTRETRVLLPNATKLKSGVSASS
jgi:integrase